MGLISPGGENLLDFLELRQVLSPYDGDHRDPLWWPQERPVPMRVARGPLGIPLLSMPGPKTLCGVGGGTLGFLSSADMDFGVLLESPQGSQSSSRVAACTCAFRPRSSSSVTLPFAWIKGSVVSLQACPGGFRTGLSHVPPWCVSILGLKVEAVQGKQVSLEWTEISGGSGNGGTTLEFLSPFLWRAPPLEMRRKCREFFPNHTGKGSLLSS